MQYNAIIWLLVISTKEITISTEVNFTAANGKGGVFITWKEFDNHNKDYYFVVEHKDESNVWERISTYNEGEEIFVLNVYPFICSKLNKIDSEQNSSNACQESSISNGVFHPHSVYFTFGNDQIVNKTKHWLPKSAALKAWMEGGTITENQERKTFEPYGNINDKQIINVTLMSIYEFHNNLKLYNYMDFMEKYNVIAFGMWNGCGNVMITDEDADKVKQYLDKGYGVLLTHDVLSHLFYSSLKGPRRMLKYRKSFGITVYPIDPKYKDEEIIYNKILNNKVQIIKKGSITNFPWEIGDIGTELIIPLSHTNYHATFGTVWIKFSDYGIKQDKAGLKHNFFLTTYNNTAMIQSGHSRCNSTIDERKLLANTIIYLTQRTYNQFVLDHSSQDLKGPQILNIKQNDNNHSISFESEDIGSEYSFRVIAFKKDDPKLFKISSEKRVIVKVGVNYIKYVVKNSSYKPSIDEFLKATNLTTSISFDKNDYKYYCDNGYFIFIAGVDKAGNVGEIQQFQFGNQNTASEKGKSKKYIIYGTISGSAFATSIAVSLFLLKKSFASAIVPSDIANNYITNAPIISYENPLYDQKSMNDSDPFDEDFD